MTKKIVLLVVLAILAALPAQAQRYDNDRNSRRDYRDDRQYRGRRGGSAPTAIIDSGRDMRGTMDISSRDWHAYMCESHTRGGTWDSVAASHCPQAYEYGYRGPGYGGGYDSYDRYGYGSSRVGEVVGDLVRDKRVQGAGIGAGTGWAVGEILGANNRDQRKLTIAGAGLGLILGQRSHNREKRRYENPQYTAEAEELPTQTTTVIFRNCAGVDVRIVDPVSGTKFNLGPGQEAQASVQAVVWIIHNGKFQRAKINPQGNKALIAAP